MNKLIDITPSGCPVWELGPEAAEALAVAGADSADWPKRTLDFLAPDGTHMVENVEEMREVLRMQGYSVEDFKRLPAYLLPLASGRSPWLRNL
jgi:hypothetical protein